MTNQPRQPIPYSETLGDFYFGDAAGYAGDFLAGAEGSYAKGARWAKYWRSSKLEVLVSQLQEGIFSIVAYPPAGFVIDDTDYIEKAVRFRGWILRYRADPSRWAVLAATERIGEDEFKRVRDELKAG
ncbi:unnamed protein product [marine sediment metagenome]|uniref:Uncharacterized protein n=1 Tax=marine sediment metagenome TaxID=412755 RepID=X1LXA7_9ZZZZ